MDRDVVGTLVGYVPLFVLLLIWIWIMRRAAGRSATTLKVAEANTKAVEENSAALREMMAKLDQMKP